MSGGWGVEFEFVEGDEGGGEFVTSGGNLSRLQGYINRGEVELAARLYEDAGGSFSAPLLADAKLASDNSKRNIAEVFRRARDFSSAAKVLEMMRDWKAAAALYEQGGDFPSAARCHQSGGDVAQGGRALERSGEYAPALEAYRRAGNLPAVAECLVRLNRFAEAAETYRQLNNVHAEVEMLRQMPTTDPACANATHRLAALMEQHGHLEKAAALIVTAFRGNEAARTDTRLQTQLLHLLEALGRPHDAAKVRATLGLPASAPARGATPVPLGEGEEITARTLAGPDDQTAHDYAHLKAIPIFGELALPDMRDLFRVAQEVSYPPGSALIEQGGASRGLMVIAEGRVDVSVVAGGQTRLLNTLSAGAYVGEIGLVGAAPASARVVAQGAVRVLFISKESFEHYLYEHPAASMAIYRLFTQNLAERVRALSERPA